MSSSWIQMLDYESLYVTWHENDVHIERENQKQKKREVIEFDKSYSLKRIDRRRFEERAL